MNDALVYIRNALATEALSYGFILVELAAMS